MKKTLAILLSTVLALTLAITCFVIVASAATNDGGPTHADLIGGTGVTSVQVFIDQSISGSSFTPDYTLNASNAKLTLSGNASGTMELNPSTGVLTLTDVKGVRGIRSTSGDLTLNLVGENVLTNSGNKRCINVTGGGLNITSSTKGTLSVTAATYSVYSAKWVYVYGNAFVVVNNTGNSAAVQSANTGVIVADNAVLDVTSANFALNSQNKGGVYLRDNACVFASGSSRAVNCANGDTAGAGPAVVSDNAILDVSTAGAIGVNCSELKLNGGYLAVSAGTTAVNATSVAGYTGDVTGKTLTVNAGNLADIAVTLSDGTVKKLYANENLNSVEAGSGKVTYDASKDTLTLDNATVYAIEISGEPIAIELKGANTVNGTGITANNDVTVKGSGSAAFSGSKAFTVTGDLILQDSASVTGTVSGAAVTVKGAKMTLKNTASLSLTSTGGTGIYLVPDSGATEFEALDNSSVYMKSTSVALYINGKTTNTVTVTTKGNTYFERSTTTGGAALFLAASVATGESTVTIENGVMNVVGYSQGVNNGVMNVGNNNPTRKSKTTVTVKDAVLNVTNNYASTDATNNAIRLNGTDGSVFSVKGKSTVTVNVSTTKTGAVQTHGIHSYGVDVNVSDTAVLNVSAAGKTDAAIWLSDADLNVTDKAVVSAEAEAGYAVSVTNGKVNLKGGLTKLYGADGSVTTGSVTMASGAKVQAGESPDGALAEIKNTFPYSSKYVQVNVGNVADVPEIAVTLSDGTVATLLRNAPWNTVKAGSGSVTYNEGVLTLNDATAKAIAVSGAELKISAKGTNTLSGNGISSDRNVAVTGETLKFTGVNAFTVIGVVTLSDDLVVDATTTGITFNLTGTTSGLILEDNVKLTVNGSTHMIQIDPSDAGKAILSITDSATANVSGAGVPVYFPGSAESEITLTSDGTSVFHRSGANASFFITNTAKNTVTIKNGTYTFSGQGGANHNAVFRIDGGNPSSGANAYNGVAADIDFVIEDAVVNVSRTQNNSVSVGMRLFGKDGSALKILGDSVVNVDVPSNAANADISAILADNIDISVAGNSVLTATARGTGSSNAAATSGAIRLVDADLTVEGNGEAEAKATKGGYGISVTNGKINVKGGTLDVTGTAAINDTSALKLADGATVKAGGNRVNAKSVEKYTDEAYALIQSKNAHEFVKITVTLADGTQHTFSRKANQLTWNKGKITYDYTKGILTLDNATDVKSLVIGEGDLNVKLVGDSEIINTGANALNTSLNGGVLKFVGDGMLFLKSDKSAALQAAGTGGQWVFAEDVFVEACSPSSSLRTSGPDIAIIITDSAMVSATGSEDTSLGAIYAYATDTSLVEVSGEGELIVYGSMNGTTSVAPNAIVRATDDGVLVSGGGRFGVYVNSAATDGLALLESSGNAELRALGSGAEEFNSSWLYAGAYVVASGDNGNATVKASDISLMSLEGKEKYASAQIKASKNAANLIVEDSAELIAENSGNATLWLNAAKAINVDLTTTASTTVKRNGNANGAAFYLQPGAADTVLNVNIKNGYANFIGASGGVNNGVVNIGYNAADPRNEKVDVNIEKAYVTITNNYSGGTAQSVGLRIFASDGTFKVHDTSILSVNVKSTKSGAELYGIYNSCVDMALTDTSIMSVNTSGVNASANGAAIMLRHADMTVSDEAELDALSNNGGYGVSVTTGNNIYFKGGISEFFGTAVTDNILAMKRDENIKTYVGDSASTATTDYRTFSGLERYARIQAADLKPVSMIYVTERNTGAVKILTSAPWNTFINSNGKKDMVYDAATGTASFLDVSQNSVGAILAKSGDLTVVFNGNTRDMTQIMTENGNLTVKGHGTVNMEGTNYLLAAKNGDLTVTGDVVIEANGSAPVIYVGGDDHDLTFSGNVKVTATGTGASIIRNVTPSGFTYIKDNAQVTVVNSEPSSWGSAFDTANFEISGGLLDLTAAGSKNTAFVGLAVSVQKAEMEAGAKAGIANFLGGKVIVKVQNDSAVKNEKDETVADSRGYGLFFKNLEEINFAGTEVDVTVTNKTGTVDAQKVCDRAAVTWQSDNGIKTAVTLSAGTLKITADQNTAGLLAAAANSTFTMKGGNLLGEAATLFAAGTSGTKYTVNGGMVDFKAHGSIVGTVGKPTVTVNASILKGAADTESKILVIGNPATSALPVAIITVTALVAVACAAVVILRKRRKSV